MTQGPIHRYEDGEEEAERESIDAGQFPNAAKHAAALVGQCGLSMAVHVARINSEFASTSEYWKRVLAILMEIGANAEEGVN